MLNNHPPLQRLRILLLRTTCEQGTSGVFTQFSPAFNASPENNTKYSKISRYHKTFKQRGLHWVTQPCKASPFARSTVSNRWRTGKSMLPPVPPVHFAGPLIPASAQDGRRSSLCEMPVTALSAAKYHSKNRPMKPVTSCPVL